MKTSAAYIHPLAPFYLRRVFFIKFVTDYHVTVEAIIFVYLVENLSQRAKDSKQFFQHLNTKIVSAHVHILFLLLLAHSTMFINPFSRPLIGSRNLRYPRLLVDFEAEVKMTGSARAKIKQVYIVLFL